MRSHAINEPGHDNLNFGADQYGCNKTRLGIQEAAICNVRNPFLVITHMRSPLVMADDCSPCKGPTLNWGMDATHIACGQDGWPHLAMVIVMIWK